MVGGKFETGLCGGKVVVNTLVDVEVKQIGQFVKVSWPVGRFSGGKVSNVLSSTRPRGEARREPHAVCFAL
jgi:hypothetical protein